MSFVEIRISVHYCFRDIWTRSNAITLQTKWLTLTTTSINWITQILKIADLTDFTNVENGKMYSS